MIFVHKTGRFICIQIFLKSTVTHTSQKHLLAMPSLLLFFFPDFNLYRFDFYIPLSLLAKQFAEEKYWWEKNCLIPFWKLDFKMNRGHISKRTDVTWNTAAARLVFALERGRQLPGAFRRGFPRLHAQVWPDRGGGLLKTVLLTGLFIFPNSWKYCKSCFCPLLFKYFCFWRKGKWKSIFKCILHFFLLFSSLFSALRRQWADRCARLSGQPLPERDSSCCSTARPGQARPHQARLQPHGGPCLPQLRVLSARGSPPECPPQQAGPRLP